MARQRVEVSVPENSGPAARPPAKAGGDPLPERRGLVLDDYLSAVARWRRQFKLRAPKFDLAQLEGNEEVKEAVRELVRKIVERHGDEIYSAPDPLLDEISSQVYSDCVSEGPYPRPRISPRWVNRALRKLVEIGLQTVAQLPPAASDPNPKPGHSSRKLKLLASHFGKLAEEARTVLIESEARERVMKYFSLSAVDSPDRLSRLVPEITWAAGALSAVVLHTTVTPLRSDSPNHQVRLALYMVGFFEHATGSQQYAPLGRLIEAAFAAGEKGPPKWIDRLAIEMYRKRRRRAAYANVIFSRDVPHPAPTSIISLP